MRCSPSEKDLAEIPKLNPYERLHYFIARVVECEEVWSLGSTQGWNIRQEQGRQVIPVWPYQELAAAYACDDCGKRFPDAVSLDHFLYRVLANMRENDIKVEVMPSGGHAGLIMSASALYEALDSKLDSREQLPEE